MIPNIFAYRERHFFSFKIFIAVFLCLGIFLLINNFIQITFAQEDIQTTETNEEQTKADQREQLQGELDELQNELQLLENELNVYSGEVASYERDIAILENEIRKIRLEMQRARLIIRQTDFAIEQNEEVINALNEKVEKQKELLSKLILSIYKLDNTSSVEIILSSNTLSDFFNDINRIKNLQQGLAGTLNEVKEIKLDIEQEQEELEVRLEEQSRFIQIQEIQQTQIGTKVAAKENLLTQSKSKEYEYEELARQKKKTISEVRNQIFRLEGAGVAVTFEEAYEYAKLASQLTGVRPAFLLSVLKQESSWGKNVGQCFLVNPDEGMKEGMGRGVNTGRLIPRIMKVSRDIQPFLQITKELGRDPYATRISCWPEIYWQGVPYGYGGAIGPAQFLPSTWMGYRDRVSSLLGRTADPWRIDDAFIASAVKLANAGASERTYDFEWCAALIYYSGRCSGNSIKINRFYSDQIMARANEYQQDIDILEGK